MDNQFNRDVNVIVGMTHDEHSALLQIVAQAPLPYNTSHVLMNVLQGAVQVNNEGDDDGTEDQSEDQSATPREHCD